MLPISFLYFIYFNKFLITFILSGGKKQKHPLKSQWISYATKSISRVLYLTIIYLGLLLPVGSSDTNGKRNGPPLDASQSCSRWGLHSRKVANALVSSYLAFPPLPKLVSAVYLCCTFLQVTLTGYYPAPCPMELGLSSPVFPQQRLSGLLADIIISHYISNYKQCFIPDLDNPSFISI